MVEKQDRLPLDKMRSLNKKGQIGDLVPAVMAMIFAGIVLVFGVVVSQELRDIDTLKNSASTTNETNAWLNATAYILDAEDSTKTDTFALTAIWRADSGLYNVSIPLANATVVASTGAVTNATTSTNTNVSYSYTYQTGEEAWEGANSTVSGLGTFADFWEIIVLAIVISVVVGLLLVVFGGRRER